MPEPIDMVLLCPNCGEQHIDQPQPERGWTNPPHRSHECQFCKGPDGEPFVWRPADVFTNGVAMIRTKGERDSVVEVSLPNRLGGQAAYIATLEKLVADRELQLVISRREYEGLSLLFGHVQHDIRMTVADLWGEERTRSYTAAHLVQKLVEEMRAMQELVRLRKEGVMQ